MIHRDEADSQGIGGTGWRPFRARARRRLSRENDDFQESASRSIDHMSVHEVQLASHRQGFLAAINTYGQLLDQGQSGEQACRGALLAYQAHYPEDISAADHVVDAILLAKEQLTQSV